MANQALEQVQGTCAGCGISCLIIPGFNDFCPGCSTTIQESRDIEAEREEQHQEQRLERVAREMEEREAWREERRQERVNAWVNEPAE